MTLRTIAVSACLLWSSLAFGQNDGRATSHYFPQFADGRFSDGTYYRSALNLTQATDGVGTCTAQLFGVTTQLQNQAGSLFNAGTFNVGLNAGLGGWYIARSPGTAAFQSGYLNVGCSLPVTAQVVYSFYAANNVKLSEATVFSSPLARSLQLIADQRDGARLGVAIANVNTVPITVRVSVFLASTGLVGTPVDVTIPTRSNYVKFLNEIVPSLPPNEIATVTISSTNTSFSAIGLRFTGIAFTTIPATVLAQ